MSFLRFLVIRLQFFHYFFILLCKTILRAIIIESTTIIYSNIKYIRVDIFTLKVCFFCFKWRRSSSAAAAWTFIWFVYIYSVFKWFLISRFWIQEPQGQLYFSVDLSKFLLYHSFRSFFIFSLLTFDTVSDITYLSHYSPCVVIVALIFASAKKEENSARAFLCAKYSGARFVNYPWLLHVASIFSA